MRKSASEVDALRRAGAAIDSVHARVGEWLAAGRTEREVGADIAEAILAAGHSTVDFVIVGSGPNGASPHHELSDRVIQVRRPRRRRHRRDDAGGLLQRRDADLRRRRAGRRGGGVLRGAAGRPGSRLRLGTGRRHRRVGGRGGARRHRGGRLRRRVRPPHRATGSACRPTRSRTSSPATPRSSSRAWRSRSSRASTSRGATAPGSRTSSSSPRTASGVERLNLRPRELVLLRRLRGGPPWP